MRVCALEHGRHMFGFGVDRSSDKPCAGTQGERAGPQWQINRPIRRRR